MPMLSAQSVLWKGSRIQSEKGKNRFTSHRLWVEFTIVTVRVKQKVSLSHECFTTSYEKYGNALVLLTFYYPSHQIHPLRSIIYKQGRVIWSSKPSFVVWLL